MQSMAIGNGKKLSKSNPKIPSISISDKDSLLFGVEYGLSTQYQKATASKYAGAGHPIGWLMDLSANKNHLIQEDKNLSPVDQDGIYFSGSQYLHSDIVPKYNSNITIYAVFKPDNISVNRSCIWSFGNKNNEWIGLFIENGSIQFGHNSKINLNYIGHRLHSSDPIVASVELADVSTLTFDNQSISNISYAPDNYELFSIGVLQSSSKKHFLNKCHIYGVYIFDGLYKRKIEDDLYLKFKGK